MWVQEHQWRWKVKLKVKYPSQLPQKDLDSSAPLQIPQLGKALSNGKLKESNTMECWSSLIPKSGKGEYSVMLGGKLMKIIVNEEEDKVLARETD